MATEHIVIDGKVFHLDVFALGRQWFANCLEVPAAAGQGNSRQEAINSIWRDIKAKENTGA